MVEFGLNSTWDVSPAVRIMVLFTPLINDSIKCNLEIDPRTEDTAYGNGICYYSNIRSA